jgi:heterodisulfide reductase subunit B
VAVVAVSQSDAHSLTARNLALAERKNRDMVAACSACYLVQKRTREHLAEKPALRNRIVSALAAGGLEYHNDTDVYHILDVLHRSLDQIKERSVQSLDGLKVAPYYGCMTVRPRPNFDDHEEPVMMDEILEALGATVVDFPMKTKCCGNVTMATSPQIGRRLSAAILQETVDSGADVIATCCNFCNDNLDNYQSQINRDLNMNINIPVLFFTQLIGLAFGLGRKDLALDQAVVNPYEVVGRFV